MVAAQEGHEPVVAILLANKADVDAAEMVSYWDAMYSVWRVYGIYLIWYVEWLSSNSDGYDGMIIDSHSFVTCSNLTHVYDTCFC